MKIVDMIYLLTGIGGIFTGFPATILIKHEPIIGKWFIFDIIITLLGFGLIYLISITKGEEINI